MGACKLTLYDHEDFGGDKKSFTSSKKLHTSEDMFDRDASGRVTGDCQNTTFLGFEHWTNHDNGGVAWLMGEGDNERTFVHKYDNAGTKCAYGYHRFFRRHDQVGDIVKIDIPPENINEGIIREDITVYGKRNNHNPCEWGHFPVIRRTSDGQYSANDTDQWLTGKSYTGQPCPSGDAYWKGHQKVSCVYKGADKIKELSRAVKDKDSTKDPRVTMYDNIAKKFCSKPENLNKIVTHDNKTCQLYDTSKALAREWCEKEDNIVDDTLNLCTSAHLGTDIYNTLAEEYCVSNPDKEFCKCYNVVNYKTVCANRPTSTGCAVAKTKLDSIEEKLGVENATDSLPCGSVCAGANVYKPDGFKSGCDITYNACIQAIDVGQSNAEINAVCNIDSTSGITDGESGGSDGSDGSDGSGGSSTVPTSVSTSAVEELKKTIAEDKKKEEEEDKKTIKKLLIGGGGGGIVSSISCIILIVIIVMVMSKKGGGGRRR